MGLKLHLGVIDQPYQDPQPKAPKRVAKARRGKQRPRKPKKATKLQTTGDVANILEHQYGVMGAFYNLHRDAIKDAIAESLAGALENLVMGAPVGDPLAPAEAKVEELFREFIDQEELAGWHDGVPTKAALAGVSHRFKHPYAKGHPRRPSFVDTGLYRNSFKAWFDDLAASLTQG